MPPTFHFSAPEIAALHDRATALWHQNLEPHPPTGDDFLDAVLAQHRANFDLWHVEDRARAPQAPDHEIAEVKRSIDRYNQLRNDLMEACDARLVEALRAFSLPNPHAELQSESPGLMIDRLSILSLKLYHTEEQIYRDDAPEGHGERNRERLALLQEQRDDLVLCLDRLWQQILAGTRRFKIYRQLKMYNDPTLNPAIYRSAS
ncbi:MAG: DUF4254 domain-containing protein [Acidobacteriaceae bacterium]